MVGVRGYGGGVIGRYSDSPEQFSSVNRSNRPHQNFERKRLKTGRIGRLNVRLTGQLLGRALNLMSGFGLAKSAA